MAANERLPMRRSIDAERQEVDERDPSELLRDIILDTVDQFFLDNLQSVIGDSEGIAVLSLDLTDAVAEKIGDSELLLLPPGSEDLPITRGQIIALRDTLNNLIDQR